MAINGFSTCVPSVIKTYKVPGTNHTALAVRAEIAPLLIGFATEFNRLVEPLDGYGGNSAANDCWGYACRKVRGRAVVSFHAGGLAIDLNATRHVLGRSGTFSASQAATIRALCKKYGLRWGGDYSGRKDEMHVEVILPRAQALALVQRLQTPVAASPVRRPTTSGPARLVEDGKLGPATVRRIQAIVGVKQDGWFRMKSTYTPDFGPNTNRALQRRVGVKADGDWGPLSTKGVQRRVGVRADGDWGAGTTRAVQVAINSGRL